MSDKQLPVSRQEVLAFLGLTLLLFVSQFLAQGCGDVIETVFTALGAWSDGWAAGIAFVTLCAVVWLGHLVTRSQPRLSDAGQRMICLVAFVVLLLSNAAPGWMTASLGISGLSFPYRVGLTGFVFVTWCILWNLMLPQIKKWFETPVDLADHSRAAPKGAVTLIAIVSKIRSDELEEVPEAPSPVIVKKSSEYRLTCESLKRDIKVLRGSMWPWQQLLRAVDRYAPRTGLNIVLVGSRADGPDGQGSHAQLELCKAFLERYPEVGKNVVRIFEPALDFENFNDVKKRVHECIEKESGRVAPGMIFVDITGGQKVTSAAAAAATIGTIAQLQYVSTREPPDENEFPKVIVSDLHPQSVPAAGG